uniref:Transcription factor TGA6 n=1 Tax=Anthurium amnicola TaxID=1678845 RepID=A0A1D1Y2W7_9ARAE
MANQRVGEIGALSESGPSNQAFAYGVHGMPAAANFFDQEGSAYFGELEEALMQGVVGIRTDGDRKPFYAARPPPTLEIFPSWPMRFQQAPEGNSPSAESTDSGSAQNTTISAQLDSDSPVSRRSSSSQHPEQKQQAMASDVFRTGAPTGNPQPKPQEKRKLIDNDGKPLDAKTLRRLAQNREAARKSRLRKKAYVQQLESSRVKLSQLEQDLHRARSQGLFFGVGGGAGGNLSSGKIPTHGSKQPQRETS